MRDALTRGVLAGAICVTLALVFAGVPGLAAQSAAARTTGLKIVVVEGEDAVNIIQQKTAVAPVVEVRDRNDQPVAGAVVRFAIQGGRASFNGARTLSVTTNVAGRAAVSGLTPTSSGAFQITASAAFQGQTAAATIAQTNVMTVAQAAGAAGAGGTSGAGAGGAAGGAGGGGGLSATTIGIVGGAVAGGTLVATQVVGGGSSTYTGPFRIQVVETFRNTGTTNMNGVCTFTFAITGTLTMKLDEHGDGTVTGGLDADWSYAEVARTCNTASGPRQDSFKGADISSPAANIQFIKQSSGSAPFTDASTGRVDLGQVTSTQSFSGALNGDAITGTWAMSFLGTVTLSSNGGNFSQSYPTTGTPVTLQKQ